MSQLPSEVEGVRRIEGRLTAVSVAAKDDAGYLRGEAIPKMTMLKVRQLPVARDPRDPTPEERGRVIVAIARYQPAFLDALTSGCRTTHPRSARVDRSGRGSLECGGSSHHQE